MNSWRDHILKEFIPNTARLTLVADPDSLLLEEGILQGIRERGFTLLSFVDHIEFRYVYESSFRSRWDRGEQTELVVVLRSHENNLNTMPYDLLQASRKLSFCLGNIFPDLNYPVVASLDRSDLDSLYQAQIQYTPEPLGKNDTKDFILRHVFGIAPELIKEPSDLLLVLLRRHYTEQRIPKELDSRFIQLIKQKPAFAAWPLVSLVTDKEAFFSFLQERWPIFLIHEAPKYDFSVNERTSLINQNIQEPRILPFDHQDIRGYIENCFIEGFLQPISFDRADIFSKTWINIGIKIEPKIDKVRQFTKLIQNLEKTIPSENAKHTDWFHFARGWAELKVITTDILEISESNFKSEQLISLEHKIDEQFVQWVQKRFAGLVQLPPAPPVMVHHIPRYLANVINDKPVSENIKLALVVIDGLAFDQWLIIRKILANKDPTLQFREHAVFSWIPSLTSVSRQAIFAGKPPIYFPNSIFSTEKEPTFWSQFWIENGLLAKNVVYFKGLGDGGLETISEALSNPYISTAGLVVDTVDKIMHGMELGTAGMHSQVTQWMKQSFLNKLISLLLDKGFRVYLTSDHGNIQAEGCGSPQEGSIADLRGERVRIYSDITLRDNVQECFPDAIKWDPVGLPSNFFSLLAPHRKAFIQENQKVVCHGGISIEELIVPFIQIDRKAQ